jgi:hypothetical protein
MARNWLIGSVTMTEQSRTSTKGDPTPSKTFPLRFDDASLNAVGTRTYEEASSRDAATTALQGCQTLNDTVETEAL